MPRPRNLQDYLDEITVSDDGLLPVRRARDWSRDKLGILAMYLPAFALACSKKASDFYFVDGLAGPGLYSFPDIGKHMLGSTPIALRATPQFARVVAMDLDERIVAALSRRTDLFGGRAIVRQGDCNEDLMGVMAEYVPKGAPSLVFMDPEGLELEWRTIEALSAFRSGQRKLELLILVPTGSMGRVAEVAHSSEEEGANKIDFMFPYPSGWPEVWQRRQAEELTAEQSREEFAEIYRLGLERLGYTHTLVRAITSGGPESSSVYHLVFASDHPVGRDIMEHTFKRMYSNAGQRRRPPEGQRSLFG